MTCTHNDEKFETPRKKRVDGATSVANFADQELVIPMGAAANNKTEESHHP